MECAHGQGVSTVAPDAGLPGGSGSTSAESFAIVKNPAVRSDLGEPRTQQLLERFPNLGNALLSPGGHTGFPNLVNTKTPGDLVFDWQKEDRGWSSPFNPLSMRHHFQDLPLCEKQLERALEKADPNRFERAMHRTQDYFAHHKAGHRWYTLGHIGHGRTPDDPVLHVREYNEAAQITSVWLERWMQCNKMEGGQWTRRTPADISEPGAMKLPSSSVLGVERG